MENYEEIIKTKLPVHGKMTVPDGYFDSLHSRIMANIDKEEASTTKQKPQNPFTGILRSYVATAACVGIIAAGVFTLALEYGETEEPRQSHDVAVSQLTDEQVADYMMIDNDDIYAMISE